MTGGIVRGRGREVRYMTLHLSLLASSFQHRSQSDTVAKSLFSESVTMEMERWAVETEVSSANKFASHAVHL